MNKQVNQERLSPIKRLGVFLPKKHLWHRLLLIAILIVVVLGSVFLFMPRTSFEEGGSRPLTSDGELTVDTSVSQTITLRQGTVKSLMVNFDAHGRQNGEFSVEVFDTQGNPLVEADGSPLVKTFDATTLGEDASFGVALLPREVAEGDELTVVIYPSDTENEDAALGLATYTQGEDEAAMLHKDGKQIPLKGRLNIRAGYDRFSKQAIVIAALLVASLSIAILFWSNQLHINVLILLLIFGVFFSLLTPIMDTPDEPQHTASAFLLAGGQVSAGGGELPDSFETLKQNYMHTLTNHSLTGVPQGAATQHTDWGGGKFILGFLPQAIGLLLGKLLRVDMAALYYMGRIANAVVYAVLASIAIKRIKKFDLYLAALALMPMSLMIAGSYNPDGITYGLALLLGSQYINMMYDRQATVGWKQMLLFALFAALLIMNKYTLALLCLLPFFIPAKRYKNKKSKWLLSLAVLAICAVSAFAMLKWQNTGSDGTSALTGHTNTQGANMHLQLQWIMQNPGAAVSVYSKTISNQLGGRLMELFTLGQLSYSTISLIPLLYFAYLAVVGFAYTRYEYATERTLKNTNVSLLTRGLLLLTLLLSIVAAFAALHLTWTPVGAATIRGVQGRYFIPLFAYLPLLGQNTWPLVTEDSYQRSRINLLFVAVLFAAFTLITTVLAYY